MPAEILVDNQHAVMDRRCFNELPEYSASLPTGTTIGKRWKRNCGEAGWFMGEYTHAITDPRGGRFGELMCIAWREILIVDVEAARA